MKGYVYMMERQRRIVRIAGEQPSPAGPREVGPDGREPGSELPAQRLLEEVKSLYQELEGCGRDPLE